MRIAMMFIFCLYTFLFINPQIKASVVLTDKTSQLTTAYSNLILIFFYATNKKIWSSQLILKGFFQHKQSYSFEQ